MKQLSRWGSNRYIIYTVHILFWILLLFPYFLGPERPPYLGQGKYRMIFNHCFIIILFYFNAYYLFPKIYKLKGWLIYIASLAVTVIVLIYSSSYLRDSLKAAAIFPYHQKSQPFPSEEEHHYRTENGDRYHKPPEGVPFPLYIFIIAISFSFRLISEYNREEKRRKEQETEALKTELSFLRSQISPHFMFNVLNTLVALARKKSDLMEPSLIQLSTLMRYVLYESNNHRISLSKEVEYLKNYVELQTLRFGDSLNLIMDISKDLEGYEIEPMLLIPFVENAFKHGLGNGANTPLTIRLEMNNETSVLAFKVENEIAPTFGTKDSSSGIGLKNIKRRLELLYDNKYTLSTITKNNIFITNLIIELR